MNGILRNTTSAVVLKYLSSFWRSREMPLINCKIELKLKWKTLCVLSVLGADNNDAISNKIILTINDIKLYVPVITLLAKKNQKPPKLLSKGFERSMYWNKHKTKSKLKNIKK